jgi:4-amino-4-deoxy-L-arabinose transferase-like glycosyltransferase
MNKRNGIQVDLLVLLAISTVLLTTWSLVVPIFEAPDEPDHWAYARFIHDHGRLPFYDHNMLEANHPPLYYWLIAPIAVSSELPQAGCIFMSSINCRPHPFSDFGKYWPLRWARLLTVVLSVITVLFIYLAAYEASGRPATGLLAGGLAGFLPQFTFRGTNISNDAMVATTSAIATYLIVRLIRRGFSWKLGCMASLSVAFAFLSKVNAIIFVPVLIPVLLLERSNWQLRMKRVSVVLLGLIFIVPWLARNQILYGDALADKVMLKVVPELVDKKAIWSPYFLHIFPRLLVKSSIGMFGWMNVSLPKWFYALWIGLAACALAGFVRAVARKGINKQLAGAFTTLSLLAIASTVQLNLMTSQPQGRYLFPALSAWMILVAIGLENLPRWNQRLALGVMLLLLAMNLYALFGVEARIYWAEQDRQQAARIVAQRQQPGNGDARTSFGRLTIFSAVQWAT